MKIRFASLILILYLIGSCVSESNHSEETHSIDNTVSETEQDPFQKEPFVPDSFFVPDTPLEKIYANTEYMVDKINNENQDISTFNVLSKNVEYGDLIKIYTLVNLSNGTRAVFCYPILQWNNNGELHAVELYKYTETTYDYILPLDNSNELFILLGDTKGDGSCHFNYAYVIQIKEDQITLKYPAFGGRPYLNFCNGKFTFNEKLKELSYQLQENTIENLNEEMYWYDHYKEFAEDSASGQLIIDAIADEYYQKKSFKLKFDGKVFI